MIGIQLIAILFALWMIYFTFLHFRRKEFTKLECILWQILWLGLVVVVLFPTSMGFILQAFSISRTFDLVVIVGVVLAIGMSFRNYIIVHRIERRIEEIVREDTLKQL